MAFPLLSQERRPMALSALRVDVLCGTRSAAEDVDAAGERILARWRLRSIGSDSGARAEDGEDRQEQKPNNVGGIPPPRARIWITSDAADAMRVACAAAPSIPRHLDNRRPKPHQLSFPLDIHNPTKQ